MKADLPLRAVIWVAVSTKSQANDEKASLPAQQRDAEALCEREGLIIAAPPLLVPGHSRRYLNFYELADDARAVGIDAFDRLIDLINTRGFDVLVVRDGDRFARTQALHAFIVESVIDAGARIYSLADGWIDDKNYRMWIAMAGYRTATEVDALVKKRKDGMRNRTQRGLPARVPVASHKIMRDEITGRAIKLIVDPAKRSLLDALADLLLAGVSYSQLHNHLFALGFINPATGKKYGYTTMVNLLFNPWFWGHSAMHYNPKGGMVLGRGGRWAYDLAESPPPGVTVHRHTHEAAYTGDVALAVQAELRRRESIRGRRAPNSHYSYTGLLICGGCGCNLRGGMHRAGQRGYSQDYFYYYCTTNTRHKLGFTEKQCPQHSGIKQEAVDEFVRALLMQIAQESFVSLRDVAASGQRDRLAEAEAEIATLQNQIETMVREQAERSSAVARNLYAQQIDQMATRLEAMQQRLAQTRRLTAVNAHYLAEQQQSAATIRQRGVDYFIQRPADLNKLLYRLLGENRLTVRDRVVYLELTEDTAIA